MVRNPKYYQAAQGLPYLDKVIWRIVPDQNTILTDLQSGSVDSAWFLDVTKTLAYQSLSKYTTVYDGGGSPTNAYSWEALWLNWNNKIISGNPEVRTAMSMAVDQTVADPDRSSWGWWSTLSGSSATAGARIHSKSSAYLPEV